MNTIKINSASLNRVGLNVIGEIRSSANDGPISYPNGVYIQHIDGKLYTTDEWTAKGYANEDANGVAVIADDAQFVIAKTEIVNTPWSSNTGYIYGDGMVVTQTGATQDFAGYEHTQVMLKTDTSGAAYKCNEYIFPNGKRGYLAAKGEWFIVENKSKEVVNALTTIGGDGISAYSSNYWTSTQRSTSYAVVRAYLAFSSSSYATGTELKKARAFCKL